MNTLLKSTSRHIESAVRLPLAVAAVSMLLSAPVLAVGLSDPARWNTKCSGCHGGNDSPAYGPPFSTGFQDSFANSGSSSDPAAVFRQYVNDQGAPTANNVAVMAGLTDADARNIGAFLLEASFGKLTFSPAVSMLTYSPGSYAWPKDYAVAMGTVSVGGSTSVVTITLENASADPMTYAFGGAMGTSTSADFYRSNGTCSGASLAAGDSCQFSITFKPNTPAALTSSMSVTTNGLVRNVSVSGTGDNSAVALAELTDSADGAISALNFGAQTLNGIYPSRRVKLKNTGGVSMSGISIASSNSVFVIETASTAPCGSVLNAGSSCNFDVRYRPSAVNAGEPASTLTVSSSANNGTQSLTLSGSATAYAAPVLAWSPVVTSHAFADTIEGQTSVVATFTLVNNGPGGATLDSVLATGLNAGQFAVTTASGASPCTGSDKAFYQGQTCTVSVTFVPGGTGTFQAQLAPVSSDASLPTPISLSGTGLPGLTPPTLGLSASSLSFSTTRINASSEPQDLEITNTGAGSLLVSAMQASGPYKATNKNCPAMPFTLAAGQHCTVSVVFAPDATGSRAGALSLTTNASGSGTVSLSGDGQAAPEASSGGGCSMLNARGPARGAVDPTLWLLVAGAGGVLWRRRQRQQQGRARGAAHH